MELSKELYNQIIDFLKSLPNFADSKGRQAFIYSSGLDVQLQEQLSFDEPLSQFIPLLVSTVLRYGKLQGSEMYALETLLVAAKGYIGQDKQEYCESLIGKFHAYINNIGENPLIKHQSQDADTMFSYRESHETVMPPPLPRDILFPRKNIDHIVVMINLPIITVFYYYFLRSFSNRQMLFEQIPIFVVFGVAVGFIHAALPLMKPIRTAFFSTSSIPLVLSGCLLLLNLIETPAQAFMEPEGWGDSMAAKALGVIFIVIAAIILLIIGVVLGAIASAGCYLGLHLKLVLAEKYTPQFATRMMLACGVMMIIGSTIGSMVINSMHQA